MKLISKNHLRGHEPGFDLCDQIIMFFCEHKKSEQDTFGFFMSRGTFLTVRALYDGEAKKFMYPAPINHAPSMLGRPVFVKNSLANGEIIFEKINDRDYGGELGPHPRP